MNTDLIALPFSASRILEDISNYEMHGLKILRLLRILFVHGFMEIWQSVYLDTMFLLGIESMGLVQA